MAAWRHSVVNGLSWYWLALQATLPPIAAFFVAVPFWRRRQSVFGSIVGTVVIFGAALGLILREYVEIDRITQDCLDAGTVCWPVPSAFTRFAIYAFVALIEVFILFFANLRFEERVRRSAYSREWQRW